MQTVITTEGGTPGHPDRVTWRGVKLSHRETQVLQRIASGWYPFEIAASLDLSIKTVDTHRRQALQRIGGRTNACLTRAAITLGLAVLAPPSGPGTVPLGQRR